MIENELKEFEEKFLLNPEQSIMGFCILQDNLVTHINQKAANLIGYSVEEIKSWQPGEYAKILYLEDRNKVYEQARKKQRGEKDVITHYEHRLINSTGEIIWVESFSKTILHKGKPADLVMVIDITGKKEAEKRLKESELKHRLIIENANDMICILNQDLELEYINEPVFKKIMGYSKEDLIGESVIEFIHPEDVKSAIKNLRKFFNVGEGISEVRVKDKNAIYHCLEVRAKTFIDQDHQKKGLIIVRDVTERKRNIQKLIASKERYRNILETIKETYFETDLKGNFTFLSDSFSEIVGYSKEESIGMNYRQVLDEKNKEKVFKIYNKVFTLEQDQLKFEFEAIKKSGEKIIVESSAYLRYDSFGNKIGFYGVARDITEQKKTEKNLRKSEKKFRRMFEAIPDLFFLISSDTTVIDYRGQDEDLYIPSEEFLGKKLIDVLPREVSELLSKNIKKIIATHQPQILEYCIPISGKFKYFEARYLYFSENQIGIFIRDISKRKQAEKLIVEEIKKLKELDKIRKEFIARVSHELKTPLTSICATLEFLLGKYKNDLGKEILELLKILEKGGKRLNFYVNNLIDIISIDSKKLGLNKKRENLSEIIESCSKEMRFLLKERNITLDLEISKKFYLKLDRTRIEQVILNLLSNAIKNTPPKGKIKIILKRKENYAEVSINDTGVGFTEFEIERLFTKFGKLERNGQEIDYLDIQGSGLGLYISKEIINLHSGKISMESAGRNKGSTFRFTLPLVNK